MEWYIIAIIAVLATALIIFIMQYIVAIQDRNWYIESRQMIIEKCRILEKENNELQHELLKKDNKPIPKSKGLNQEMDNGEFDLYITNGCFLETEKERLEKRLEEIKFAEKYPLCEHIKVGKTNSPTNFKDKFAIIEFFINGKSIGRFTNEGAIDYAKKSFKQIDWAYLNDGMYDVVKKPSKK